MRDTPSPQNASSPQPFSPAPFMRLRYGIVTPPAIGHLNPMVALALE